MNRDRRVGPAVLPAGKLDGAAGARHRPAAPPRNAHGGAKVGAHAFLEIAGRDGPPGRGERLEQAALGQPPLFRGRRGPAGRPYRHYRLGRLADVGEALVPEPLYAAPRLIRRQAGGRGEVRLAHARLAGPAQGRQGGALDAVEDPLHAPRLENSY